MRIGRLGLVGLAALAASCGGEDKPARFRVGGTVTGLAGGGLGLRLNDTESLTRETDGPFTFQQQLEDKSTYTVTVSAQPAEQDCTVEGGTGQVAGADVSSVQVRCATRTYTVGGTVEGVRGTLVLGLDGGETLQVTQAGRFTFTAKRPKGGTYAVSIVSTAQGQRCTVTNGSGTVAGNVEGISVRCHDWFELVRTQAAKVVIGQQGFPYSEAPPAGSVAANTLSGPWGKAAFANGRLYITDQGANRVLGFNAIPAANNAAAGFVLGQSSFTSTTAGKGRTGLDTPAGLSSDGTRLAVTDTSNNRVLLHTTLPASTGAEPALVIGQPDFTTTAFGCARQSLSFPEDVFLGHGKLLVADSSNQRVLIWNTVPTTSGAPPDLVLGQSAFDKCLANDTNGDGVKDDLPSASTMWNPTGVWTDGTRLLVSDGYNHRVLLWNQFPTRNGQPADLVLGQPDFTSRATATTATGMRTPYSVTSTGVQLFVSDQQNNRVLVWNQLPTTNGQAADLVLGQPDFTSAYAHDPATGSPTVGDPSARSTYKPTGVHLVWPHVVVSDHGNNRVLVYESP